MFHAPSDLPPRLPLERLNDIDWGGLRHAYGTAEDVPDQIRALAGDQEQFEQALSSLYGNVFHQGTRYEASPFVVPFLVEMLERPGRQADLLRYLLALAIGYEETWFPSGFPVSEAIAADEEQRASEAVNEWGADIVHTNLTIARSVDRFVTLLDSANPDVAAEAAHLLAYIPSASSVALPALRSTYESAEGAARASAALAIAVLSTSVATDVEVVSTSDADPVALFGSLCARVLLGSDGETERLLDQMLDDPPPIASWMEGNSQVLGSSALSVRKNWLNLERLNRLAKMLQEVPWTQASIVAAVLLDQVFRGAPLPDSSSDLSIVQRAVLEALVGSNQWSVNAGGMTSVIANWASQLRAFGVPSSASALSAYLDGDALSNLR